MSNLDRLEKAGLIKPGSKFSKEDHRLLESLSHEEVEALISVKRKVGDDFLRRNTGGEDSPVGIVF